MEVLLDATHREDTSKSRLQTLAYKTLNEVVQCSTKDIIDIVMQRVPDIMLKINETLEMHKI